MISSSVAAGNRKFSEENSQNASNTSSVIQKTAPELPQEEKSRGKRMMGVLMGTLSKFKSEESDKSEANLKRILLEQRLAQKLALAKEMLEKQHSNAQVETPEAEQRRVFYASNVFPSELQQIKTETFEACANFERTQTQPVLYFKRAE